MANYTFNFDLIQPEDDDYYDINNDLLSWIKPGEFVDLREILDEVDKDG